MVGVSSNKIYGIDIWKATKGSDITSKKKKEPSFETVDNESVTVEGERPGFEPGKKGGKHHYHFEYDDHGKNWWSWLFHKKKKHKKHRTP